MDVSKYDEAKAAGNVEMRKYGESFQVIKRQFNPDTGEETMPQVSTFTEQELLQQKSNLEKMLASVNTMLTDVQTLKK